MTKMWNTNIKVDTDKKSKKEDRPTRFSLILGDRYKSCWKHNFQKSSCVKSWHTQGRLLCVRDSWWGSSWSPESRACWPGLRTGENCWTSGSTQGWSQGERTAGRTDTNANITSQPRSHTSRHTSAREPFPPGDTWTDVCPRIAQHRSRRSHWQSCDSRLSGCSTAHSREAPPTRWHTFYEIHFKTG